MITMITKETILQPLNGLNQSLMLAQEYYAQHSELKFLDDFFHYVFFGQVLITPQLFVIAKMIMLEGEPAFFIRFACGPLGEAIEHIPKHIQPGTKWIAFCRNNKGNVRKYRIARLLKLGKTQPSLLLQHFVMNETLEVAG